MSASLSRPKMIAWMIWIIASIFYAYQYILRVMPNILLSDIMQRFHIDAAAFGQFAGVYYLGYSLMHLPIGLFFDRYGPKKVMSLCMLLTVLGMMPLVWSSHWIYPIVGRCLIGIGSSAAILGVFKILRMSFKEKQFPRLLSFSVMIGLIGAIYGGEPINYLLGRFGYETVIYFLGIIGLALAIITYWLVPHVEGRSDRSVGSRVKEVLANSRVIWSCFFAGFMVGPLEGFADVWATVFLKELHGLQDPIAASLPSLIFIGMCFGSPVLNLIAEKTRYSLTIIGSGAAMTLGFAALCFFSLSSFFIGAIFIAIGVCCAYQILVIYKVSTYVREEVSGITTAMANMIIMIFGYVFHTAIGSVVQAYGGASSPTALLYGVLVIPVMLSIGVIGFIVLFLKNRRRTLS